NEIDKFGNNLQRLNRTEAQSLETRNFQGATDQFVEARLRMKIAAVCAQMDSREDDLFIAARDQAADFIQGRIRIDASAAASHRRNDAEGAIRVTAILDLHDRSRAAAGTQVGCGFQLALQEDAAANYFGAAMRGEVFIKD